MATLLAASLSSEDLGRQYYEGQYLTVKLIGTNRIEILCGQGSRQKHLRLQLNDYELDCMYQFLLVRKRKAEIRKAVEVKLFPERLA